MHDEDELPELCYSSGCPRTDLLRDGAGRLRRFRFPVVEDDSGRVQVYAEGYSCPEHQPIIVVE